MTNELHTASKPCPSLHHKYQRTIGRTEKASPFNWELSWRNWVTSLSKARRTAASSWFWRSTDLRREPCYQLTTRSKRDIDERAGLFESWQLEGKCSWLRHSNRYLTRQSWASCMRASSRSTASSRVRRDSADWSWVESCETSSGAVRAQRCSMAEAKGDMGCRQNGASQKSKTQQYQSLKKNTS